MSHSMSTLQLIDELLNIFKETVGWKFTSFTQFSQYLGTIAKHLRSFELFDHAMGDLEQILIDLYANNRINECEWIKENEITIIRIKIFSNIQTIGQIFEPTKNTKDSIKSDLKNYKSFFSAISKCISSQSHSNSYPLFTKNQIKKIKKYQKYIFNYNDNEHQQSIVEKQYNYLEQKRDLFDYNINDCMLPKLQNKLSVARLEKCENVLNDRTDRIFLILDQCHDIRNQFAMLRTAELFGVQNVWIVKAKNYKHCASYKDNNRMSTNSQLWLSLRYFNSSKECIYALKTEERKRKIWIMNVDKDAMELTYEQIQKYRNKKRIFPNYVALVMGKEDAGISDEFIENCDEKVYLSQYGFCQSYNVSVACALGLKSIFEMNPEMRGKMDKKQKNKLRFMWYYQLLKDKQTKQEIDDLMRNTFL